MPRNRTKRRRSRKRKGGKCPDEQYTKQCKMDPEYPGANILADDEDPTCMVGMCGSRKDYESGEDMRKEMMGNLSYDEMCRTMAGCAENEYAQQLHAKLNPSKKRAHFPLLLN